MRDPFRKFLKEHDEKIKEKFFDSLLEEIVMLKKALMLMKFASN
ncbi:hypothetical protein [Rossellomorea aquimaris]|nr:hypothetical protein [Rossellomorea aquimaris]